MVNVRAKAYHPLTNLSRQGIGPRFRQPHDLVLPRRNKTEPTTFSPPQSHRQSHCTPLQPTDLPTFFTTVKRPNLSPSRRKHGASYWAVRVLYLNIGLTLILKN
jgi:hypothetical protein